MPSAHTMYMASSLGQAKLPPPRPSLQLHSGFANRLIPPTLRPVSGILNLAKCPMSSFGCAWSAIRPLVHRTAVCVARTASVRGCGRLFHRPAALSAARTSRMRLGMNHAVSRETPMSRCRFTDAMPLRGLCVRGERRRPACKGNSEASIAVPVPAVKRARQSMQRRVSSRAAFVRSDASTSRATAAARPDPRFPPDAGGPGREGVPVLPVGRESPGNGVGGRMHWGPRACPTVREQSGGRHVRSLPEREVGQGVSGPVPRGGPAAAPISIPPAADTGGRVRRVRGGG